ncbi:MAG: hypothetical protein R2932_44030 [Caldilineaceae bacterium]
MSETPGHTPSNDAVHLADQLLVEIDTLWATLHYEVIVELRRRVEAHKFNDPVRALQIAETA